MENIILGIAQGIFEWLPISSSAVLLIMQVTFFQSVASIEEAAEVILFLHMGTFFSALVYFHKDITEIIKNIYYIKTAEPYIKNRIIFLTISTVVSGMVGLALLEGIKAIDGHESLSFNSLNIAVGSLLILTGAIQFYRPSTGKILRTSKDLVFKDGIVLGFLQGLAALPGISRSGITIAGLMMRKIETEEVFRLSFIMGLPITLLGNIFLNIDKFNLKNEYILGLISSFIVGIITIHILMKLVKRLNFGFVALFFGILLIISGLTII